MEKVKVIRVLIYEGPRDWMERTLAISSVPLQGERAVDEGVSIKSILIKGINDPDVTDATVNYVTPQEEW